jgi:hypothetical protein
VNHFRTGLLLGFSAAGIAYACGATPVWTALLGASFGAVVWAVASSLDHR